MSRNRGSILQVVLVIFLILFTSIFSYCTLVTRRHWRSTIDQDILLSDTYEIEERIISYTVDDDGRDYLIDCDITTKSYHYTMQVKIDMETLDMHECIYGH